MTFRLAFVAFPALAIAASAAACSSSPTPVGTNGSAGNGGSSGGNSSANTSTEDGGGTGANSNGGGGGSSGGNSTGGGGSSGGNSTGGGGGDASSAPPKGCPSNTGFPGDDMCLAAPAATDGFQLHYGPSTYDSADEAPYVLQPGQETTDCYYEKTGNTTDRYIGGFDFQMRPGSHHIIMNVNSTAQPDGFAACGNNDQTPGLLYASQTPTYDLTHDPAPENAGLAVHVPANSQAVINFHVINAGTAPLLREAWLNYFYIDPSEVKGIRGNVFLAGGLNFHIAPGTNTTYDYSCSPSRPVRILSLASHMHAHATRMTMWKVSGGQQTMIYEGYSWENPAGFSMDSVHQNPMPNRATQTPGAMSGQLILQPTDSLQWECAIDNTSNDTLTFTNQVYKGEMCIAGGTMVPADNPMSPFDFDCERP